MVNSETDADNLPDAKEAHENGVCRDVYDIDDGSGDKNDEADVECGVDDNNNKKG